MCAPVIMMVLLLCVLTTLPLCSTVSLFFWFCFVFNSFPVAKEGLEEKEVVTTCFPQGTMPNSLGDLLFSILSFSLLG